MHWKTHFDFNISSFEVESDLKLEILYNGCENLQPVFFQWCVSVSWNRDFPHLI